MKVQVSGSLPIKRGMVAHLDGVALRWGRIEMGTHGDDPG